MISHCGILAKRLKMMREYKGLSQRELSKKIDISHISIARYETGVRVPDIETLCYMAKYFETSLDWLCGMNDN